MVQASEYPATVSDAAHRDVIVTSPPGDVPQRDDDLQLQHDLMLAQSISLSAHHVNRISDSEDSEDSEDLVVDEVPHNIMAPGTASWLKEGSNLAVSPQKKGARHRKWTEEEDLLFRSALDEFGYGHWKQIASRVKSRTAMQCKNRGRHLLDTGKIEMKPKNDMIAEMVAAVASGNSTETESTRNTAVQQSSDVMLEGQVPRLPVSDFSDESDIDLESEAHALNLVRELTRSIELQQEAQNAQQVNLIPQAVSPPIRPAAPRIPPPTSEDGIEFMDRDSLPSQSDIPDDCITNEEVRAIPEWFPARNNLRVHPKKLKSRTADRYVQIRRMIFDMWQSDTTTFLTKSRARSTIAKLVGCDVNAVGQIHDYLNDQGYINAGIKRDYVHYTARAEFDRTTTDQRKGISYTMPRLSEFPKRKRKVRDADGNWVRAESSSDESKADTLSAAEEEIVTRESIMPRRKKIAHSTSLDLTEDPFQLIDLISTAEVEKQHGFHIPYSIDMCPLALSLIDVHCHMYSTEVIGLMGGRISVSGADAENLKVAVSIEAVYPCSMATSSSIQCEMDPLSELKAHAFFGERGLRVVGWYHSHPSFANNPSRRDVETQALWQSFFRQEYVHSDKANEWIEKGECDIDGYDGETVCIEPFFSLIDSPFDRAETRSETDEQSRISINHVLTLGKKIPYRIDWSMRQISGNMSQETVCEMIAGLNTANAERSSNTKLYLKLKAAVQHWFKLSGVAEDDLESNIINLTLRALIEGESPQA